MAMATHRYAPDAPAHLTPPVSKLPTGSHGSPRARRGEHRYGRAAGLRHYPLEATSECASDPRWNARAMHVRRVSSRGGRAYEVRRCEAERGDHRRSHRTTPCVSDRIPAVSRTVSRYGSAAVLVAPGRPTYHQRVEREERMQDSTENVDFREELMVTIVLLVLVAAVVIMLANMVGAINVIG